MLVTDHRREKVVIGIGTLEVDRIGSGVQVAECRYVASEREPFERYVSRPDAGRIAVGSAAAEVRTEIEGDTAQFFRIGDGLQKYAGGSSVQAEFLMGGIGAGNGDRGRNEILCSGDSVEVIRRTQSHLAAEREGEFVLLGGEDEVRQFILLETGMMGFDIVPNGIVDCQLVQYGRFEQGLFVRRRLRRIDGNQVNRRRVFAGLYAVLADLVGLGRNRGRRNRQQHCD